MRQGNDGGSSAARQVSRVRAPVEVPEDIVQQVRTLCLALPEVTVRVDGWAQSFDIRRRSFCLLVARQGPAGKPVPLLVLRANPDEREALLFIGRPFFAPRAGRDRIGVLLTLSRDGGSTAIRGRVPGPGARHWPGHRGPRPG